MNRRSWLALFAAALAALTACTLRKSDPAASRTPVVKTAAELAAERSRAAAAGQLQPGSGVVTVEAEQQAAAATRPAAIRPGTIYADVLLVNDTVLTAAEVLYPLWDRLAEARSAPASRGVAEAVRRMIFAQTQQDVGILLLYEKAVAGLTAQQRENLDKAVEREFSDLVSREFAGSRARCEAGLGERGLTLELFKTRLKRQLVAQQYAREELRPRVRIARAELLEEFARNGARYNTPGTRELWMIEAPFAAFLDGGRDWDAAPETQRAQARLRAVRHIRAAHAALAGRSFEDVAREFSRGVSAADGGNWGRIGEPLQPPLEDATKLIFGFQAGQYSTPVETPLGWVIVRCGEITPAYTATFADSQERIRAELTERRFAELLVEYIGELSKNTTLSSLESFVTAATQRVLGSGIRVNPQ